MVDITKLQNSVFQNKLSKGFNTTDVNTEFCLLYGEVAEAFDAYKKGENGIGEELADIAIYLMGLSQMLGINLEEEILKKIAKNENRRYEVINGVLKRICD